MRRTLKAVLVGDSGVGKTAIFQRMESNTYEDSHIPTVGGAYTKVLLTGANGEPVDVGLWDTAGQERFRNIVPMYFQRANVVLVVFDVTQRATFENIEMWCEMARAKAPETAKIMLIGNKSDLIGAKEIEFGELQNAKARIGAVTGIETSAMNGDGFDILKEELVRVASSFVEAEEEQKGEPQIEEEPRKKGPCDC